MATGGHKSLSYVSARSELKKTDYLDLPFADDLAAHRSKRADIVERLEALEVEEWSRGSIIRDRSETVATYVRYLADHDIAHCEQIEALVGVA
jgi:hypothetical protein